MDTRHRCRRQKIVARRTELQAMVLQAFQANGSMTGEELEALPELARKPITPPAKPIDVTPDPMALAPAEPAAPLAVPTQVAAR